MAKKSVDGLGRQGRGRREREREGEGEVEVVGGEGGGERVRHDVNNNGADI